MLNKSVDVLQEYRSKTHKPCSPNPETLRHLVHANNTRDLDVDNGENEDKDEGQGDEPVKKKCAPHSSKEGNCLALSFYPPGWKSMLIKAKQDWQYYLVTKNPFLNCNDNLADAAAILENAIIKYEDEEGILEDGLFHFRFYQLLLIIFQILNRIVI